MFYTGGFPAAMTFEVDVFVLMVVVGTGGPA
jgi:hypothetical protein